MAALLAVALLPACTFQSTQGDMIRSGVESARRAIGGEEAPDERYRWVLTFNQLETRVYAVQAPDGIVFANRDGVRVAFDGWDVVGAEGLPNAIPRFRVEKGEDGRRVHHVDGAGTFEVRCEEPVQVDDDWRTDCTWEAGPESAAVAVPMTHRVVNDADGRVRRIEAEIVPGARPLILERRAS